MRILICTLGYAPSPAGGAERQAQLQAEELSRRGHSVTVVTPRWPGTHSGLINDVPVWRLPVIPLRPFVGVSYAGTLFLLCLAKLRRFDLVAIHLAYYHADAVVLAARLFRKPVWIKIAASGPMGEIGRMHRLSFLTRYFGLRHAAKVQATSPAIELELRSIGVCPNRIVRMPNGVDTARFKPGNQDLVRQLRINLRLPESSLVVLYVGRLASHKGVNELRDVWSRINHAGALLVMVGSKQTMDPAKLEAADDTVRLEAWTDDIASYYRCADIFVLPSHVEGMSNALLEAMACGLPVIATRVGAADDMISDGTNGMLVEPGDLAQLGRALRHLMDRPDERHQLGLEARRTVISRYSIEKVVDAIEAAYLSLK